MSQVLAVAASPFYPHTWLATSVISGADYGFMLGGDNQVGLAIPLSDPNDVRHYSAGKMLGLLRPDRRMDWWGFMGDTDEPGGEAYAYVKAQDHSTALFAAARTAKAWGEMYTASGEIIRRILGEAGQRAEPPLEVELPDSMGPVVRYAPNGESVLSFLNTMWEHSGWEWDVSYRATAHGLTPRLRWEHRIGHDRRHSMMFEEGHHFTERRFGRHARGFLRSAISIGGTGAVADRPAVQVNPYGRADRGVVGQMLVGRDRSYDSPTKAGTRSEVEPFVDNQAALGAAGQRMHASPDLMAEALTFRVWDAPNVDGVDSIDTDQLELGALYRVRFLARGLQVNRDIRAVAIAFSGDHSIEIVGEVLPDEPFPY